MAIQTGSNRLLLHGIFEAIGIFIAFRYYLWLKKRHVDPIPRDHRIWIVIAAALGSVFGSRLLGAMEDIPAWLSSPNHLAYFWGNKTLVGGLLGGLIAVELTKMILHQKQKSGDLFVFPLLLGMIIGRIGCFTAGVYEETYGLPTRFPWAMDLGDHIYRHPVVLYEIIFLIGLAILLKQLSKRIDLDQGALFKIMLMAYLSFRFLLDFIKPGWRPLAGLGMIQLCCLLGLLYYGRYLIKPSRFVSPSNPGHAR